MIGKLYIIATPIGNLGDMTTRAIETLQAVDLIAAEDTRVSMTLLRHFDIKKKIVSYHRFNETARADSMIGELLDGKNIALISDAGTPCISDPGYVLVRQAVDAGIDVIGVCGANAAITALSISGFSLTSFAFYGFLPRKKSDMKKMLEIVAADHPLSAVFYESPKRIQETIAFIGQIFPDADICLCNDLTKKFERIYRGDPASIGRQLAENPDCEKGEYTIVLHKSIHDAPKQSDVEEVSIEAMLVDQIVKHGYSLKEAVGGLYEEKKGALPKKTIYAASLRLKEIF